MESKRSKEVSVLLWAVMAALFSQNLVVPVLSEISFEDQKNFFYPDPHATTPPTPPTVSYTPPAGGHSPPTPSHGGSSNGGTPPTHCGNPPSGGHHHPTPSPPTHHGGGYYHSPPTSTPSTPTIGTPPVTITPPTPTTPTIPIPSPPSPFDPNSPPFTCTYWRNHPALIWGLIGWWGSVGNAFGVTTLPGGVAPHTSLVEALSNTRTDGYGELYREGTAALLNSMAHTKFPYTTQHVRDSFVAALSSNKAATAQAELFKLANEGRIKPRA